MRHEYIDGALFAMGEASRKHNTIAANLTRLIANQLDGGPCRAASFDMKARPASGTRIYYPDIIVNCNDVSEEPDDYVEMRPAFVMLLWAT